MAARWLTAWAPALPFLPAAAAYEALQEELRTVVRHLIHSLPSTGIYEQDVDMFQAFCRHMVEVFSESPRSVMLADINAELLAKANADEKQRTALLELLALLHLSKDEPLWTTSNVAEEGEEAELVISFLQMMRTQERVSKGNMYARWEKLVEKSQENAFDDEEVRMRVAEGMRQKAVKQGREVDEEEISRRLRELHADGVRKCMEQRQRAGRILEELAADPEYARYARVGELWEALGCDTYAQAFKSLDKQVGEDRRSRGNHFEDSAPVVFGLVVERLREEKGVRGEAKFGQEWEFSYRRSAAWIERRSGKDVGEIDVLVLAGPKGGELKPVAMVEFKSMFYEIASAFCSQHRKKLEEFAGHAILDRATGEKFFLEGEMDIFVATLVPAHSYIVGADKNIMDEVMEVFQMGGGYRRVVEDREEAGRVMRQVAESLQLTLTPVDVLEQHPDKVVVIT